MGRERAGLGARDPDDADRQPAVHQGDEQHAAEAVQPRHCPDRGVRYFFGVRDGEWLARPGQPDWRESIDGFRKIGLKRFVGGRIGRRERCKMDGAIEQPEHGSREAAEQSVRAGRDGLEHRPHIGG